MKDTAPLPHAAVVYESMFGNTGAVAEAVADGLRREGIDVTAMNVSRPSPIEDTVELLVLGAPTHGFSLSRPSTRADAVKQGADRRNGDVGLREWLSTVSAAEGAPRVAIFDTRVDKVRRLPFGAARTTARLARRRGFSVIARPAAFIVTGTKGPLANGEIERASAWGQALARQMMGSRASTTPPS